MASRSVRAGSSAGSSAAAAGAGQVGVGLVDGVARLGSLCGLASFVFDSDVFVSFSDDAVVLSVLEYGFEDAWLEERAVVSSAVVADVRCVEFSRRLGEVNDMVAAHSVAYRVLADDDVWREWSRLRSLRSVAEQVWRSAGKPAAGRKFDRVVNARGLVREFERSNRAAVAGFKAAEAGVKVLSRDALAASRQLKLDVRELFDSYRRS